MDADRLNQLLLVGSVVLLLAVLAVRVSLAAGLPSLLIYLGMGLALGDAGPIQVGPYGWRQEIRAITYFADGSAGESFERGTGRTIKTVEATL